MFDHRLHIGRLSSANSLKARIYDALKSAITAMDIYAPDAELRLDERDLSARFGISRTPLREALALLDREGIVRIVPRRGIFIVRKSRSELVDMIAVWAAVEGMAARVAATEASDTELEGLRALVDDTSDRPDADPVSYAEANIGFHRSVIATSRNAVAAQMTSELLFHVRALRRHIVWDEERRARSVIDHHRIVSALQLRDGEEAERLVRAHTMKMRDDIARASLN